MDLFDEKQRLRQGAFNLKLWPRTRADMSVRTGSTPGLPREASQALKDVNTLLQKVDYYERQEEQTLRPVQKERWID